ncbi:MAG: glycosyltransferase family 2 protein [Candidatus Margulisiibacteriota bacterium]|jgi:glycosyltransferase involved in cell wall biosynthesis
MKNNLKVAVFIPTYNAAKTLPIVLDRIPDSIKKNAAEIFVVDDASADNTYLIGIGYQALYQLPNLKIYKNEKNKGYGGNQKFAYRYAIDNGFDVVVMLHGDAQYAPEKLEFLLKPFEKEDADMVFGSRMAEDPLKGGMPLYKFLGNKFLTKIANIILRMNLSEYHSGYRAYSCHALQEIPFEKCADDFHFDTDIIIQFKLKGLRIAETPIPTYYGDERCHVNVISYGLNVLLSLFQYWLHAKGIKKIEKYNF